MTHITFITTLKLRNTRKLHMTRKIVTLFLMTFMTATISIEARYGGGYHGGYHGGGYHGGYHDGYHGGYWGGAGLGMMAGATTVGLVAAADSGNKNSQDPVAMAQADQMRYDMMQQQQDDFEEKRRQKALNDDDNDEDSSRVERILTLKKEIARLESSNDDE